MNTLKWHSLLFAFGAMLTLNGCAPVVLTLAGAGASAGATHTLNGYNYRTFLEPLPKVKKAALTALKKMDIKIGQAQKNDEGHDVINAMSPTRDIELVLESITPKTTRLRAVARNGTFLVDAATAKEIIAQTEKALAGTSKL